ncbi:hypothetical protein G6W40_06035 [Campylobacter concisus]|uniref:hypothetical protein n=1 Tax=Campylobacter concisus TaxID=199 RepID=UPI0018848EEB|nr:hypothetical protein [Campylobacter concisus]MBE9869948.1 hypothetical protein [Campylobacter concisus]
MSSLILKFDCTTFVALALYQSKANSSQNFAKISHYKTLNLAQTSQIPTPRQTAI